MKYINLKNLFLCGFVGGFIISLLKLSNLSTPYSVKTVLTIFVAVFCFIIAYLYPIHKKLKIKKENNIINVCIVNRMIIIITLISLISFIIEAIIIGYIPILKIGTPHAYSDFHIFGVHYLTTIYPLIAPLSIISIFNKPRPTCILGKKNINMCKMVSICGIIYSILMPIVLVSRFQLIFVVFEIIFTIFAILISNNKNYKKLYKNIYKIIFGLIILFIIFYLIITYARSHSVEYLNGIFDMKNKNMPIFITQPYMYISQNYENLNYAINNMEGHSYGARMLYPLFSLTLVNKLFPHIMSAAFIVIKSELTTTTLIYDFYADFGILGVIFFMSIIGYLMRRLDENIKYKNNNILYIMLFSQNAFYMLFSFFQSFYSLTATWVYMIFTVLIYMSIRRMK